MTTIDTPLPSPVPGHERAYGPGRHRPTFGFTLHGRAVHANTLDHLPVHSAYARFNKRVALIITNRVGTMSCFWLFCIVALIALPAALVAAEVFGTSHGSAYNPFGLLGQAGFVIVVEWLAQSFIQLVLLPALMVGQNLQNEAADARAAKTFEDVERIIDLLDCDTSGGLQEVMSAIVELRARVDELSAARPAAG